MPREWPESSSIKEWTELPEDGYDYNQHMLTDEKAKEILELGGGSQHIFVMAPADLASLEKDPYFTGELEVDPAKLEAEERNLCLDLKDNISISSGSVSDVEDLLDFLIAAKDSQPTSPFNLNEGAHHNDHDADDCPSISSSMAGYGSEDDENGTTSDLLTKALNTHLDSDLQEALKQMDEDEDDFDEAEEQQDNQEDIRCLNECVDLYNIASRSTPAKAINFGHAENRLFIEQAVKRQLEEESDLPDAAETEDSEDSAAEIFHFDKTLLVNMATSETAKQRQRPIVEVTSAKQVDIADLMF